MLFLLCIKYFLISMTVASSAFQVFHSKDIPEKSTTPEEFIRMTKGITVATAKAVAAGNSAQQEDVISTANLSRKAISDMLTTCKVLIHHHTDICPLAQTQYHRSWPTVRWKSTNTWIPTKCVYIHSPCAMNAVCSISQCHLALTYFWLLNYAL